jgi:phosphatidylserine/phosphatidylglycerophosphate/cardiolipin synthase-like enzyme
MSELLTSPLRPAFLRLLDSIEDRCLICSPYITMNPVRSLVSAIERRRAQDDVQVKVIADISPVNLVNSSTDIDALIYLTEQIRHVETVYLPRIHAKVFISGESLALVTSANFTDGGFSGNLEYGVMFDEPDKVRNIATDMQAYTDLGGVFSTARLMEMREHAANLRTAIRDEQRAISAKVRAASAELLQEASDHLFRVRVQGKTPHAIFSDTIRYLLSRGPMTTPELHQRVQEIHPDICNDELDRIIDGQRFGKLWKHQVRTAQQHLKQRGQVVYDPNLRLWSRAKRA